MTTRKTTKDRPYKSTPRLSFRLLTPEDEELYCSLYADTDVVKHVCNPLSRDRALVSFGKALALTQHSIFHRRVTAIVEKSTKKAIGISNIHMMEGKKRTAMVGSMLTPSAQANGYGPEYSRALMDHAFRVRPVDKLVAEVGVGNSAMEKLVTEFGFTRGRTIPATQDRPAQTLWTLTRAKWKKLNSTKRK